MTSKRAEKRIIEWMTQYQPERTVLSAAKLSSTINAVMDLDEGCLMPPEKRAEHIARWAKTNQ